MDIEVGHTYADRQGVAHGPMKASYTDEQYPFEDENGRCYTKTGRFYWDRNTSFDLVVRLGGAL